MPRTARIAPGDMVFHVLNRANAGVRIFDSDRDYRAFEFALGESCGHVPMRILDYCIMPNHWHLVLWPHLDGDLGRFMQRLTTTHVRRWHVQHETVGRGHLYQGTYKSFAIQRDAHFLTACRYVERNPVRANLADRAEHWRWGGLWLRCNPGDHGQTPPLCSWPVPPPEDWLDLVNRPLTDDELEGLRLSTNRGRPFGLLRWQRAAAQQLGLDSTLRPPGRPTKKKRAGKRG